jgi:hypothetical protein
MYKEGNDENNQVEIDDEYIKWIPMRVGLCSHIEVRMTQI